MTREEAIQICKEVRHRLWILDERKPIWDKGAVSEAILMAIEALKADITKWQTWSHTYDNACMGGEMDDLISRAEAIEAIENTDWYHQNQNKDMVSGANDDEHQAWYKADDVYKALEAVPSADRQMVIKCKPFLSEEDFKAFAEQVSDQNVILISNEAEVVSTNTSTNTSTKSTNISTDTSADTVEVVRCKDCRHRVHDEERGLYYCEMYYGQGDVSDENFCQWGERSEDE